MAIQSLLKDTLPRQAAVNSSSKTPSVVSYLPKGQILKICWIISGLQLDNPLNVLSQDSARQFLSNSTPSDKYKFFLKGTQLEQLDREYRLLHDNIDQSETQIANRKEDVEALKNIMVRAEQKKKEIERASSVQDKIHHMIWMHAWVQVEDMEKKVYEASQAVVQATEHLKEREEEAKSKSDEYDSRNDAVVAAAEVRAELDAQLQQVTETHDGIKEEFDKEQGCVGREPDRATPHKDRLELRAIDHEEIKSRNR